MNKVVNIAVLLSSYNGEKYIREQIDSILDLDVVNDKKYHLKLYVRDDGSTDSTLTILEEYKRNGKIEIIPSDSNLGPAKSFLSLLNAIEADYYAFSDQDDVWNKNKISRALERLESIDGPAIYYANAELVDKKLHSFNKYVYSVIQTPHIENIMCCCNVLGCTMVLNNNLKRIFDKQSFLESNIGMHDYYLCMLCMACGGNIIYDSDPVMLYRQHDNNVLGYNVSRTIGNRVASIFKQSSISIAEDAKNLLRYESDMTDEGKELLRIIENYKNDVICRGKLILRLFAMLFRKQCTKHEVLALLKVMAGTA